MSLSRLQLAAALLGESWRLTLILRWVNRCYARCADLR